MPPVGGPLGGGMGASRVHAVAAAPQVTAAWQARPAAGPLRKHGLLNLVKSGETKRPSFLLFTCCRDYWLQIDITPSPPPPQPFAPPLPPQPSSQAAPMPYTGPGGSVSQQQPAELLKPPKTV